MPMDRINGVNMWYEVRGDGPPIIFVHPPLLSSMTFISQVTYLSNSFKTIIFDIRGHGKSEASTESVTYPLIVEDIKKLMDFLQIEKAFICGYSAGGSIALEFLLTYPNRSYSGILVGAMSEVNDLRLKLRILFGIAMLKIGALRPLAFSLAWSNAKRELFWQTFNDAKKGHSGNVEQYYHSTLKYNCTERLSRIGLPVLLLYGVKDRGFFSYGQLLHKYLRHSKLVFIDNVKHQVPTKADKEFNQRIRNFVNQLKEDKEL